MIFLDFTIAEKMRCVDAVSHVWHPLLISKQTKYQIEIHLGKFCTARHLAHERVKGRIGNNEGSHIVPVVL